MRTKTYTLVGIDADADALAAAAAPTAGTALTLEAVAAGLDPVRFVTLTSGGDASAVNFTIVGTDRWGNAMSEVVVGPSANTVQSVGAYASVTSITPDATSAQTVSAGWPDGAVTPWVLCGRGFGCDAVPEALVSVLAELGTVDGDVEVTYDMFPRLPEAEITVDQQVLAAAFTPGTPQAVKGQGVRFVMTSGAGTQAKVKFTRPGP